MSKATLQYRILPNSGAGWCWELMTGERVVIARGVAETHAQACIDALNAGLDRRPQEFNERKFA